MYTRAIPITILIPCSTRATFNFISISTSKHGQKTKTNMQKTNKHMIWQTSHHAQNKTKTNKQSGLRLPFGETSRSLYDLPAPWPFAWHRCCLLWSVIFSASAQHHSAQPSIYDSALPVSSLCPRSLYRPSLSLSGQRYTCPPRIALNASAARRWHSQRQ